MMRRVMSMALSGWLIAACVTVNVYFPAAAAEQAADRLINDITSQRPNETAPAGETRKSGGTGETASSAAPAQDPSMMRVVFGRTLELLVPAAHAQASADLDVSTPEIRAITAAMKQRFGQLEPYFASGAVGLTANGDVAVRDQASVPLAERAVVKRLVAEDNADRATLYAEIAKANGQPDWEADIRRTFARRWIETGAKPGWYYQDSGGNWVQR